MPDYLVTDPSTGQRIKMTGPAPPSEALIRLALAKVQPLPSHEPTQPLLSNRQGPEQTADPMQALQGAQTIGPSRVGERYLPPTQNRGLMDVVRSVIGGAERPQSVAAQDPFGTGAYAMGAGPMPGVVAGALGDVPEGLYSRLDQAIAKLPDTKLPPMKILSTAKNATSGEEIAHRGLADFLQAAGGKPVARADVQAHLAANPIQLDVKVMGGGKNAFKVVTSSGLPDEAIQAFPRGEVPRFAVVNAENTPISFHQTYEAARSGLDELETMGIHGSGPAPKYSQYQVPGGTAYKETLITQPEKAPQALPKGYSIQPLTGNPNAKFALQSPDGSGWVLHAMTEEQAHAGALNRLQNEGIISKPENFRSSHFDQPNILVHVRSNERTLPSGEKGLFGEEFQSDLHQKGKAEGYQQPIPPESKLTWNEYAKSKGMTPAEASQVFGDRSDARFNDWMAAYEKGNEIGLANQTAVPDLPFKDDWIDLAFKHQLLEVAKRPDLEWFGFTPSEIQIKRWGSERLRWAPEQGGYRVAFEPQVGGDALGGDMGQEALARGLTKNDSRIVHSEKELESLLGGSEVKAAKAWKRIQANPTGGEYLPRAEGFKFNYDEWYRKRLEKIVKPFGGTVERAPVATSNAPVHTEGLAPMPTTPAWIVRLTPEMKQRIMKGLPLMTGVAAVAASQQEQK